MTTLITFLQNFVNSLPPLLQLFLGVAIGAGIFKIVAIIADSADTEEKKK